MRTISPCFGSRQNERVLGVGRALWTSCARLSAGAPTSRSALALALGQASSSTEVTEHAPRSSPGLRRRCLPMDAQWLSLPRGARDLGTPTRHSVLLALGSDRPVSGAGASSH